MTGLADALPAGQWKASQEIWTPTMVCQAAGLFGERKRAEQVTEAWEEGRLTVWVNKMNPNHQIAVSLARFDTVAAARRFCAFVSELERKEMTNQCAAGLRLVDTKTRPITLAGADEAELQENKLPFAPGKEPEPLTRLLAQRKACVLEITWQGVAAEPGWAERILGQLRGVIDQ
jgi:hypothetical protein